VIFRYYNLGITLPIFSEKIKIFDYNEKCPICGRKNCAIRFGTYKRKSGTCIQRYLCSYHLAYKKKFKTFSLLPWPLIPYHSYSVEVLANIEIALQNKNSHQKIANTILPQKNGVEYGVLSGSITYYSRLFQTIILKWMLFIKERDSIQKRITYPPLSLFVIVSSMAEVFWIVSEKFLVGTPSQDRIPRAP
jgi:hypothetical protein